jgi:hypothetical protein
VKPFRTKKDRRLSDVEAREQRLLAKVGRLEDDLRTARFNAKSKMRQNERLTDDNTALREHVMELQKKLLDRPAGGDVDVPRELATLRRQLALTQRQLDDATKTGDVGLLTVRPKPRPPAVTA